MKQDETSSVGGSGTEHYQDPSLWEGFAAAVQFLTRIPVTLPADRPGQYYAKAFRRSLVFFPVVGGLIGLFTALIFLGLVTIGIAPTLAAWIAVGCEALLTGAFHEDAFADSVDALGGGWTREQVLEIMRDSRLGSYGTLALIVGVGIRVTAMTAIADRDYVWAVATIVAAASIARLAILTIMATTAPIPDRVSKTNGLTGYQPLQNVWSGALLSAAFWIGWVVYDFQVVAVTLFGILIMLFWFRGLILRRVGGTTGDLLGCSAYLVQLFVLIGSSMR